MKHLLALIGLATIVAVFYLWGGGVTPSLKTLVTQVKRATAADSAELKLELAKIKAASLKDEALKAKTDGEFLKIQFVREKQDHEKELVCIKNLANALKKAGGPKVSDMDKLSEKVRQKKIVFLGQELTVEEGYEQLIKLQKEYDAQNCILERKAALIERLGAHAEQLSTIRENLLTNIEKLEIMLKEQQMDQRFAILEAKNSEMAASAEGRYLGSIGEDLQTMETAIVDAHTRSTVARNEIAKAMILNPEDSSNALSLDSLWEK